jgi:hypothetical protein
MDVYKATVCMDGSVEQVLKHLMESSLESRAQWDPLLSSCEVLKTKSSNRGDVLALTYDYSILPEFSLIW